MADVEMEEVDNKKDEIIADEKPGLEEAKPEAEEIALPEKADVECVVSAIPDVEDEKSCDTTIIADNEETMADSETLDDLNTKSMNGGDLGDSYCANFGILGSSMDSTLSSSQGSLLQSSLTASKGKDTQKRSYGRGKRKCDNSQQLSSSKKSKT